MGHTVASVAARTLVVEKETKLQHDRINTLESTTSSILAGQGRIEGTLKVMAKNGSPPVDQKANGKKPRRLELLFAAVALLTILNFLGLIEPLGAAFRLWITGGT